MLCRKCGQMHNAAFRCDYQQQLAHLARAWDQSSTIAEEQEAIALSRFFGRRERRKP